MYKIINVETKSVYILPIICDDDARGEVSIVDRWFGPMFESLNESEFFTKASVDQFGAVCWPNDTELAPDPLYRKLTAH